jgi:uncharacterized membrane protein YeaQ/YmgE (transglycosylase-associated protein family)
MRRIAHLVDGSSPFLMLLLTFARSSMLIVQVRLLEETAMGDPTVGWIAAIIIGGIAGWLAEQFMKSDMGLLMNIALGIVGAAVASAILSFFGIALGGWVGYLIAGFIGACLLIWVVERGQTKNRGGHQPKFMAPRSLSIVEAKSNSRGLPRRDQDEPSSPVNVGLKLTHLSVGSPE